MEIRFGFWPRVWQIRGEYFTITPLADIGDVVRAIRAHDRYHRGWIHPPLEKLPASSKDAAAPPLVPVTVYSLPATHTFVVADTAEGAVDFLLAVLGVLEGMRLVRERWTHFHKAAVEPHKLTDLICTPVEIRTVLDRARRWWDAASAGARSLMFGAIHWHLFASGYELEFAQFAAEYTVLDTLFAVHREIRGRKDERHFRRPSLLANEYGLCVPDWATIRDDRRCDLADIRNQLVHEARFAGAPIGFDCPDYTPTLTLQVRDFVTRLIVGMLNVDCLYVQTPAVTGQMHALEPMAKRPDLDA